MKHLFLLLVVIITQLSANAMAAMGPARVLLVDGDVMFHTPDSEGWLPATVNTPLDEGDAVWAPVDGKTEIQLVDGTVVRLDGGSQLDLLAVEDGFTHLHLNSGRLYLRTTPTSGKNSLQIDADDTTVLPDARTRLRIDMLPNSQEDVTIIKGLAYVEGNGSRTKVRAGEHIALEEGHNELLPLNPPDEWDGWNTERDRNQYRVKAGETYLPDDLRPYSGELDNFGQWFSVPEYGMVWQPTAERTYDWAPYRDGRWVWKGDDYVWVSYEGWGWIPYHYGRWAVISGFGWCWIPPERDDVFWGPGYVGWYNTGTYVGWTPLAPSEIFYGRKQYGRHSVNIVNTPVTNHNIRYKNRDVRGGFIILRQNDFLRGKGDYQRPANAASFSVSVSLGGPRLQPARETRMPVIKQTPPRVTPPAIQHRDARDLQSHFPRVTPQVDKQKRPQPVVTAPQATHLEPVRAAIPPATRQQKDSSVPLPAVQQQRPSQPAQKEQSPASRQTENRVPASVSPPQGRQTDGAASHPAVQPLQRTNQPEHREQQHPAGQTEVRPAQPAQAAQSKAPAQGNPSGREVTPRNVWKLTTKEPGGLEKR